MRQSWDSSGDSSETHRVTQVDSPPSDVLAAWERDLIGGPRQTQVDSSLQGSTAFDLTVDDSDNVGEDCDTVPASNFALREAGRQVDVHGFPGVRWESGVHHPRQWSKQVCSRWMDVHGLRSRSPGGSQESITQAVICEW